MAEDDQDKENKTEEPTHKRLEEAFKKGQIAHSREVGSFLMLIMLAFIITSFAPSIMKNTKYLLLPFIASPHDMPASGREFNQLLSNTALGTLGIIIIPLMGCVVAAIAGSFVQNGFVLSSEPLMPKLNKISPLAGLKRLFSMRSVVELIKGIIKIIIVGIVAFMAVKPELTHLRQLPNASMEAMLIFLGDLAFNMMLGVIVAMFFIAIFDVLYQRFQFTKSLRMSKQEIKDEYKQSEGDPVIKQRLRQLRMERAKKRMMAAVPKADVVITNPTHFAVALQYDSITMKAPVVLAKGQDLLALKMREIAEEHDVPIVENPPLARALFSSTDVDEEIPLVHYEAVAKVISYVYQLKGRKK